MNRINVCKVGVGKPRDLYDDQLEEVPNVITVNASVGNAIRKEDVHDFTDPFVVVAIYLVAFSIGIGHFLQHIGCGYS